ncbi:hypothetical protein EV182_001723, partial [Spiromyces aspiralis]
MTIRFNSSPAQNKPRPAAPSHQGDAGAGHGDREEGMLIYQSPIANSMKLLKMMSLAGSVGSSFSTVLFSILQDHPVVAQAGMDITTLAL